MKLHERFFKVQMASAELSKAFLNIIKENELTDGEALKIVAEFSSSWVHGVAKNMVRKERHGDEDKEGDLE